MELQEQCGEFVRKFRVEAGVGVPTGLYSLALGRLRQEDCPKLEATLELHSKTLACKNR